MKNKKEKIPTFLCGHFQAPFRWEFGEVDLDRKMYIYEKGGYDSETGYPVISLHRARPLPQKFYIWDGNLRGKKKIIILKKEK